MVFVDWMKAIAILAVIGIHPQRPGMGGSVVLAVGVVSRFAVPTFLFVAGLLHVPARLAVVPVAFVAGSVATWLFVVLARRALGALAPVVLG